MKKAIVGLAALAVAIAIVFFSGVPSAAVTEPEPATASEPQQAYPPQPPSGPTGRRPSGSSDLSQPNGETHVLSQSRMEGGLGVVGTRFVVTDSEYLNLAVETTQPVTLSLQSVPEMVTMHLASAYGAAETQITLAGLAPLTTYHKYEDGYRNHVAFTTDSQGTYRYDQDISMPHLVFIQPEASSTIFLGDTGLSSPVGTWYPITRTAVLTQDLRETIEIVADDITLDGNGHTLTGSGTGNGILVLSRSGIRVVNTSVRNFSYGFNFQYVSNANLTGNSAISNRYRGFELYGIEESTLASNVADSTLYGISLSVSSRSTLTNNTMLRNRYNFRLHGREDKDFDNTIDRSNLVDGRPIYYVKNAHGQTFDAWSNAGTLYLVNSDAITVRGLTLTNNGTGIYLWKTTNSSIDSVQASNNWIGIDIASSSNITLSNSTFNSNNGGISLLQTSNTTLKDNDARWNSDRGISLASSTSITMTGNAMWGNKYNFGVQGTTDSDFANEIDTSNLVDGKPIYYIVNAANRTFDASTNAGTMYLIGSNDIAVTGLTLSNNENGLLLWNTRNARIDSLQATANLYGIRVVKSSGITITNSTANANEYGLTVESSSNSITLTGNTVSSNATEGIRIESSSGITLVGNTANWNRAYGIYLYQTSGSKLIGNTTNSNSYWGISLEYSSAITITGNTMSRNLYNFGLFGFTASHYDNTVDTSNLVDGKPIYYLKNASNQTLDASTNAGTVYLINSNNINVTGLTLANNGYGVFLWNAPNSRIENVHASSNYYGIFIFSSDGVTLNDNNVTSNSSYGIYLHASDGSTITGNTANSNSAGVFLVGSRGSTIIGNQTNSNFAGGILLSQSGYGTVTANTASSNRNVGILVDNGPGAALVANTANYNGSIGIVLTSSGSSTLAGNRMSGNRYNFSLFGETASNYDNTVDTSNLVDGKPIYYLKNASDRTLDASTNAGTVYLINGNNINVTGLTLTNNGLGVFLYNTRNSRIEGVQASNNVYGFSIASSVGITVASNTANLNDYGINVSASSGSIITNNTANLNDYGVYMSASSGSIIANNLAASSIPNSYGILIRTSTGITVTRNTLQQNNFGIRLDLSRDNTIYNNNFLTNTIQARVSGGSGNVFNLAKPIGGNHWSNWTSPHSNGFVDLPYIFTGGRDDLPWVRPDGWLADVRPSYTLYLPQVWQSLPATH